MGSENDELHRAIQLSLQTRQEWGRKRPSDVVDLTGEDEIWSGFEDSEEMDFWRAITVSMGEGSFLRISDLMT